MSKLMTTLVAAIHRDGTATIHDAACRLCDPSNRVPHHTEWHLSGDRECTRCLPAGLPYLKENTHA